MNLGKTVGLLRRPICQSPFAPFPIIHAVRAKVVQGLNKGFCRDCCGDPSARPLYAPLPVIHAVLLVHVGA